MLNPCGIVSFFTLFIRPNTLNTPKVTTFEQRILSNGSLLRQYLILLAGKTTNETVDKTENDRGNC